MYLLGGLYACMSPGTLSSMAPGVFNINDVLKTLFWLKGPSTSARLVEIVVECESVPSLSEELVSEVGVVECSGHYSTPGK